MVYTQNWKCNKCTYLSRMNTPPLPYGDTCREIKMLRLGIPLVGGSNQTSNRTMDNRI